jgi:hypothetical protein
MQILSPTADNLRQFDFFALDGLRAITCEIKSVEDYVVSDWWVTGSDSEKNLKVLTRVNVPLKANVGGTPLLALIQQASEELVRPLVRSSQDLAGVAQTLNPPRGHKQEAPL